LLKPRRKKEKKAEVGDEKDKLHKEFEEYMKGVAKECLQNSLVSIYPLSHGKC
jgi:hypothetical protein